MDFRVRISSCIFKLGFRVGFFEMLTSNRPNESVPHFICSPEESCCWQKYRCNDELAGKFIIDRGFAWELLTFSSISTELAVETLKTEND